MLIFAEHNISWKMEEKRGTLLRQKGMFNVYARVLHAYISQRKNNKVTFWRKRERKIRGEGPPWHSDYTQCPGHGLLHHTLLHHFAHLVVSIYIWPNRNSKGRQVWFCYCYSKVSSRKTLRHLGDKKVRERYFEKDSTVRGRERER